MATIQSIADCPPLPEVPGVEFRHVPEFPGYAISDDGVVWSCRKATRVKNAGVWKQLKPGLTSNKHYRLVILHRNVRRYGREVHRLVLTTFVGPPPSGHQSRHLDGNGFNNHLSNLRWGTRSQNEHDKIRHGTASRGERNGNATLTAQQIIAIRSRGPKQNRPETAEEFGITTMYVGQIIRRGCWKHLQ